MRIPIKPKPFSEITSTIPPERFTVLLGQFQNAQSHDRYLHWDELRRRPAPEGLSHEEWWLLLKLRRVSMLRSIPLAAKDGHPFRFGLPDPLIAQLHAIDCGLGSNWNLPESVVHPTTRNEYIISTLMQEAITSSQLEGAVTTREVAKEMLRTGRPPRDRSERMILNNYLTMRRIMDVRGETLTPELVFELHRTVTEGTLDRADGAGRFRREDEAIRVVDMEGNVFHEPPKAGELLGRMAKMCAFANGQTPDFFVHPVIRAILLHFWLAYDHPFVDGNGRTARALFYWSMLHQEFRLFEFISISQILLRAPAQYARAFLHTETDDNDLTYFLLHQAEVIQSAVQALHEYVERKVTAMIASEAILRGASGLNHRQQALLTHALRQPVGRYTIEAHRRSHGVVYQTARTDLLDLASRGLLVGGKEGRTIVFRPPGDLDSKLKKLAEVREPPLRDETLTLPLNFPSEGDELARPPL